MASLSIPTPAAPTPTRLDWRQTGERSSTFRSVNKSRGGAGPSDRGRGGRGARRGTTSARGGKEKSTDTAPKSAPSIVSPPSTTSKNSSSSSPPSVEPQEKPRAGSRRAPQNAAAKLPSLTIQPASPTTPSFGSTPPHSASTTSSKLSTRRRRSHNKTSAPASISSENLTVEMLASAMKARKSRSGPSSPHAKESPAEKSPPSHSAGPTVGSFSTKSNIDSLVEHVRALAMDHRPSTPGSHIDWAGDEDDSLPDLDDWGVPSSSVASGDLNPGPTTSTEKARLQLMSPILDDSLKQLPQNFDKTTPSPSVGSGSLSPNIANGVPLVRGGGLDNGVGVAEAPSSVVASRNDKSEAHSPALSAPSSKSHPTPPPVTSQPPDPSFPPEPTPASKPGPSKDTPPHISVPTSQLPATSVTPPTQPGRSLTDSMHAPSHATCVPSEACSTEPESDAGLQELAASTDTPGTDSCLPESKSGTVREEPHSAPVPRRATHGRSHTLERQPPFSAGASRRGFLSGSSTPAAAAAAAGVASARGPHHGRTQSSPVTHRRQHSRPVITMDAMTRLAKTLGTALPKREVAAATTVTTNSATSTE